MPPAHVVDAGTLGEYAEVLMTRGQAAADALLPEIAEHLEAGCVRCDADLDELVALLEEPDDINAGGLGDGARRPAASNEPPAAYAPAASDPAGDAPQFLGNRSAARDNTGASARASNKRPATQRPATPVDSGVFVSDLPDARAVEAEAARRHRLRRVRDLLLIAAAVSVLLLGLSLVGLAYVARQTQEPVRVPLMPQPGAVPSQNSAPGQNAAPAVPGQHVAPAVQPGVAPTMGPVPGPASGARAAPEGTNCPVSHPVKGNRESMIYHLPGGSSYAATRPEVCFAAPADAEADGYRRSQR
jgi:hypothetical protein